MTFWEDQAQQAMQGMPNGPAFAIFAAIQANTEQQERIAIALEQIAEAFEVRDQMPQRTLGIFTSEE